MARDLRALPEAARHGVGFGVTIAATRHRGPDHAEGLARFAAAPHAGELAGPGSVRAALDDLGAAPTTR